LRPTFVCPDCGVPIHHGVQIVSNDNPPFQRFKCESCGREGITEDLVMKRGLAVFAHRGRPHPKGQGGGGVVTDPDDFPRIWMYYGTNGFGIPALTTQTLPGTEPSWNETILNKIARWQMITLNTQPFLTTGLEQNYAIIAKLRTANPTVKLLFYDQVTQRDINVAPGSPWTAIWDFVSAGPDKRMYCQDATGWPYNVASPIFWDIGDTGAAAGLAVIWKSFQQGKADGYFLDTIVSPANSNSINSSPLNYAALGYASLQDAKDTGRAANTTFINALLGTGEVWINRGVQDAHVANATTFSCKGELFEGWDPTHGGKDDNIPLNSQYPGGNFLAWNFDTAMTHGCLWQGSNPTGRGTFLIKSETDTGTPNRTHLNRSIRYTLASAAICGGMAYIGDNRNFHGFVDQDFWADEYSVNLSTGTSDSTGARTSRGWLGKPTEFGHLDTTSGMWIRHFDRGVVVANGPGSTLQIDLGRPYRRLRGFYDTSVNDGSLVQTLSVPAKDGRFLLNG